MAKLINIDLNFTSAVSEASELYHSNGVFIYPTDTIYGIGCNPFDKSAMETLSRIKKRERDKRYIFLIDSLDTLQGYVTIDDEKINSILKKVWPNPVSIVFNLNNKSRILFDYSSAAFRIPDNKFCNSLLNGIKAPLVSTSVNISNKPPLVDFDSIVQQFDDKVDAIFYSKKLKSSGESTLIDFTGKYPRVLREGKINFIGLWKKFG